MDMNRIREFLSRTGLGMFLVWGCAAVLFLVAIVGSSFWGKAGVAVGVAATVVFAGTSLWYVLVFLVTLAKRQWKKSAIMFVSGGVGASIKTTDGMPSFGGFHLAHHPCSLFIN